MASRNGQSRNGHMRAPQIVRRAIEQVAELTGREIEGVNGFEKSDDGWLVTLEVVELRRVPDSTDVLGSYTVELNSSGELEGYRRTHRYYRSQVEES
jgi:Gas vesicle synthesis protein GvpO